MRSNVIREFISYPKSGRTWLRYALVQLGVAKQIAFHHDGCEFNSGNKPPFDFRIESRVDYISEGHRIVYLCRDPRDTIVSLYFQVTGRFKDYFHYQGGISEFIRDDYFGANSLQQYRSMWEQLCTKGLALKITYEDCHKDFELILKKVVDYYEFSVSDIELTNASRLSSFKEMKNVERSGLFPEPWLQQRNNYPKVRNGNVGGFMEILSLDDIDYLNSIFGIYLNSTSKCNSTVGKKGKLL